MPRSLIKSLGLMPHPEGGHYREFFRSGVEVSRRGERRCGLTSIYFLLQAGEQSRWHVVDSDEAWHFFQGDALELITYAPQAGTLQTHRLEPSNPVHVVPAGHWQAARPTGEFSLVGCTVGPGFDFQDFRFVSSLRDHRDAFETTLADYADLL